MSNPRVFKSEDEALREQARLIVADEVWAPILRVEGGWSLKYDPQAMALTTVLSERQHCWSGLVFRTS